MAATKNTIHTRKKACALAIDLFAHGYSTLLENRHHPRTELCSFYDTVLGLRYDSVGEVQRKMETVVNECALN